MIVVSENWKTTYPMASVGILAMANVSNPQRHEAFNAKKEALEENLRERYAGYDRERLRTLPKLASYHSYYKQFRKTYHVQLQLESIVQKGKSLPRAAALVEAMFMAELEYLLLTAGHDLDAVEPPVTIDVAQGDEQYLRINGQEQRLKAKDMMITDARGILSSIIYGPDQRTKINPGTTRVLFTTYATPGIQFSDLWEHLETLQGYVRIISPDAELILMEIYPPVTEAGMTRAS
jgi:DNA/RNA-binding domain of Phe-tRNA-synthetase-like protein